MLLFVGLIAFGVLARAPNTTIDDSLAHGRPIAAPPFRLAVLQQGTLGARLGARLAGTLASGRVSLRQLRGIPVVLNYWASWCDPCRDEARLLERGWRNHGRPKGVLFVGIDIQDATPDAHSFLGKYGVDYPILRDPGNQVGPRYGTTGIPETFFINAHGKVVGHVIGIITPTQAATSPAPNRAALTAAPDSTPSEMTTCGALGHSGPLAARSSQPETPGPLIGH